MITLAALTFTLGAQAAGIRFTFHPEPAIAVPVQTHQAQQVPDNHRGAAMRDYLIRLAVRVLAGHARTSNAPGAALREPDAQIKIPLYPMLLEKPLTRP